MELTSFFKEINLASNALYEAKKAAPAKAKPTKKSSTPLVSESDYKKWIRQVGISAKEDGKKLKDLKRAEFVSYCGDVVEFDGKFEALSSRQKSQHISKCWTYHQSKQTPAAK